MKAVFTRHSLMQCMLAAFFAAAAAGAYAQQTYPTRPSGQRSSRRPASSRS